MPNDSNPAVGYVRRLYDDVLGWYRSADTKAQVVLGIDSAFVAFLTSAIFAKPVDLKQIVAGFSSWTSMFLVLMLITLLLSISAAIHCLWSRIYSKAELSKIVQASGGDTASVYEPRIIWFFQMVAALDVAAFRRTLEQMDSPREVAAMASQIYILSGNVQRKHRAANLGFLFAAATLILFLAAGISYALRNVN